MVDKLECEVFTLHRPFYNTDWATFQDPHTRDVPSTRDARASKAATARPARSSGGSGEGRISRTTVVRTIILV